MTTPATTLDQRYSDPESAATSWDETRRALERAELFWITTVRADGRPHVTPLVAVWLDGALHFCTGAEEQKARNLAANPQVILTTGDSQWDAGLDVMVEGEAVPVTDDSTLRRLAQAGTAKWDGRWKFAVRDGCFRNDEESEAAVPVYAVRPARVMAFGKGSFSQTAHQF
jgi:general stress protein 26